jgi:NAD(P)-dependent dehydrogenase (short-subunit alcohol dehydrogenase family)
MAGKQASLNISVYAATKGGVIQMTQAFANEFGRHGIRANAICPSYVHPRSLNFPLFPK